MQPVSASAQNYDRTTILLHWATAILVAAQWLEAQTIDWFPRGPLRVDAKSEHITVGLVLAAILLYRAVWRLTRGRRLPPARATSLHWLAKATHWALYALLAVMVTAGIAIVLIEGENMFNLFAIPGIAADNHDLGDRAEDFHGTIGYIILAVAGFHACAALLHHYYWRDGVLRRMLQMK